MTTPPAACHPEPPKVDQPSTSELILQGEKGVEMSRVLNLIGMTIGGWLGWQLGILFSIFTAFVIGMVGTGLGLYASQRITKRLLP
jgi:hypothetical protein